VSGERSICWHCGEPVGAEYITVYLEAPLGDPTASDWIAMHPRCAETMVMYLSTQLDEKRLEQRKASFHRERSANAGHA